MSLVIPQFQFETQEKIEYLSERCYDIDCMVEFIKENSEQDFISYYEDYVDLGEQFEYEAVDEYIREFGIQNLNTFEDSFKGQYNSFRDFSDELFDDVYLHEIPENLRSYIDYDAFANDLQFDFTMTDSGYIFSNY